jgi:hypothetical protein
MPSVKNLGREPIWRFAPESHFDELGSTQDSAARVNHLISVLPAGARAGKVHKSRDKTRLLRHDHHDRSGGWTCNTGLGRCPQAALGVLTKIQAANHTSAEHRALSNAWTSELSIEIPETGLSIGELERALKTRFGHDQHIDGELVQTEKGGLALTVRGTGILPETFTDDSESRL